MTSDNPWFSPALFPPAVLSSLLGVAHDYFRDSFEQVTFDVAERRRRRKYTIGVITALSDETVALQSILPSPKSVPPLRVPSTFSFLEFDVPSKRFSGKDIHVAHCQAKKMGNNAAAVSATALLVEYPEIQDILITGIAGGIPQPKRSMRAAATATTRDHVMRGDILVSAEPIFQYDLIKLEHDKSENRARANPPSHRVTDAIDFLLSKQNVSGESWNQYLEEALNAAKETRPVTDDVLYYWLSKSSHLKHCRGFHPGLQPNRTLDRPMVHRGKIGSANILLKDPIFRDNLRKQFGLLGVEMEASGIADAAWAFNSGYCVIRSVQDYCDLRKDEEWRLYACLAAAAFTRSVIESLTPDA